MDRSIDNFLNERREIEASMKSKKSSFKSTSSGRGIDSFFQSKMDYYQEADEEDAAFDQVANDLSEDSDAETEDTPSDTDESDGDDMEQRVADAEADANKDMDIEGEDTDNKAPVETDGINGTIPEEEEEPITSDGHDEEENMKTFGQHGGDNLPNNQYDPQEIAKVMEFVSDEAKSLSDYIEAAKTSKVDILQRLYSDIADEERYHMEQLLFAKAEITGEEYKPHDPDIRKEYEELLSMGMDEGSAMATAVDKFNLHVTTITPKDDENLKIAVADMGEAVEEMDRAFLYMDTINIIAEYCTDDYVLDKIHEIHSPQIFQEDVNVSVGNHYSVEPNPIRLLLQAFRAIHRLFQKIARFIHMLLAKNFARITKAIDYVKQHGIAAVFQHGVSLYLWNDKSSKYEIDPILYYTNCALWACQEVIKLTKMRGQYATQIMNIQQVFDLSGVQKSQYTKKVGVSMAYQYLSSIDPIKTKIVVTPKNAQAVENEFFTSLQVDDQYARQMRGTEITNIPQGGFKVSPPLQNVFNKLDRMFQVISTFSNLVQYFTGEFEDLQNDNASVFYTNKKMYNQCVDYLQGVSKGLNKMSKICSSDLSEMNNLLAEIANA